MSDDKVLGFGQFAGKPAEPSFRHSMTSEFPSGAPMMVSKGYLTTPRGSSYARCESLCHTHADLDAQRAFHEEFLLKEMTRHR